MYQSTIKCNIAILLLSLMASCGQSIELAGFDAQTWRNDRKGCEGKRAALIAPLMAQKSKIQGLGQNQIMALLGKPDVAELAERQQKFFFYYYDKGKHCLTREPNIRQGKILKIRFNALDRATEIEQMQ